MKDRFFNKNFFIGLILLSLIILFSFLAIDGYSNLNKNLQIHNAGTINLIDQRMVSLFFEINNFPKSVGNDILFLSELSSMEQLINSNDKNIREQKISDVGKDFLGFLRENKVYYQFLVPVNGEI